MCVCVCRNAKDGLNFKVVATALSLPLTRAVQVGWLGG